MTFSNHISIFLGLSLILLASNLANATTSSWSTSVQTSSIPITSTSQAASSPTACSVTSASTFDVTISSGKTYPTAAPTNCDAQSEILYDIGQSGCSPQGNATELQNCLSGYLVPASTKRAIQMRQVPAATQKKRPPPPPVVEQVWCEIKKDAQGKYWLICHFVITGTTWVPISPPQ